MAWKGLVGPPLAISPTGSGRLRVFLRLFCRGLEAKNLEGEVS